MENEEFETAPDGRVVGIRHSADPLKGQGRSISAGNAARQYLDAAAQIYRVDPKVLAGADMRLDGAFKRGAGLELRQRDATAVRDFTIVSFQQTFDGLPVWEHGLTVRLKGADNEVVSSASSLREQIDPEGPAAPPRDRVKKALDVLGRVMKKAKLSDVTLTHSRDVIYRYAEAERVHREDLPQDVDIGGHFEHLIPDLPLDKVSEEIGEGSYRKASEILFKAGSDEIGDINWRALVDWKTDDILYVRALVSEAVGAIFTNDPISLSGDSQLDPLAQVALLNAQKELVALERLVLPGGGANTALTGEHVALTDVYAPNIAPPTEPGGNAAVFDYSAESDNFAAVCGYYTHDWLYQLMENMGFDLPTYFDGASFPVPVDHRWSNTVNARAEGNPMGNGIGQFIYSFAATGSQVGIATDPRVVAHEFGHGVMWDHLNSPNFAFAHGIGDALAAILFDPDGNAPDRFRTFPFSILITRRHDRSVASGWGWGGPMDFGSYSSTQIVSTLIFRLYRGLGGDDLDLEERQFASRYTAYLMFHAVPFLAGVVPNTVDGFATAMQDSDQGTVDFEGSAGGWAHKVVRWSFEKQDHYNGAPPPVDIYIEDGRGGEYEHQQVLDTAPGIWNRHRPDGGTGHETPRSGVENYLYVRVGNRGSEIARNVKVQAYRASANKGATWPGDWAALGDAIAASGPVRPGKDVIVGPIPWCPEGCCDERILASATTREDKSNADTIAGSLPTHRLALADNNVAMRRMDLNCPEDDKPCGDRDDKARDIYRYSVKFVCGCSKGGVVAPGRYWTAINVRNTSDEKVTFRKRFSVALPNERPGNVSEQTRNQLGPWEALEIDCEDIAKHTKMPEGCFIKGFAVLESEVELDVIAVYTAAGHDGEVETMDVEEVCPKRVKAKRPPDDIPPPPPPPPPPPVKDKPDLVPAPAYRPGPPLFPSGYCHSPKELRIIVRNLGQGPAGATTTRVDFYEHGIAVDVPTPALDAAGGANDETVISVQIPPECLSAEPFDQKHSCKFKIIVNANPADGVVETDMSNNSDTSSCTIAL